MLLKIWTSNVAEARLLKQLNKLNVTFMKKLLRLPTFAILLILLGLGACQKENDRPISIASKTTLSQTTISQSEGIETNPEANVIYTHNGQVISFESLNSIVNDDNIECYAGYSQNPNEILVFFNADEVNTWLHDAPENIKKAIQSNREYNRIARQIALSTGAIQYYEKNGQILPEYQIQLDQLSTRIFGNSGDSRGLGFLHEKVNFSGASLPVLGLGVGYPILWQLDRNLNSVKIISAIAIHSFTTKQFYFGKTLIVSGWSSSAWTSSSGWVPVLGAATPLTVQFIGVLFDWGTFSPTGNKLRTYRTTPL